LRRLINRKDNVLVKEQSDLWERGEITLYMYTRPRQTRTGQYLDDWKLIGKT